jgi:hypothetical protein
VTAEALLVLVEAQSAVVVVPSGLAGALLVMVELPLA